MALPGRGDVNIVITATDKASGVLKRLGGGFAALGTAMVAGLAAGAAAFAGIGVLSLKAAVNVESAFAGVAKTTDGLINDFGELTVIGEELKRGFRDLAKEVPVAVEELMGIGELAGQLGVPRDALIEFTETVAQLAVTTNLTQEEAASSLARLANIFQISSEDMAQNTADVGAALVDLGNNFATTESDILAFGTRIAGAGKIAGLTQADILGIGTAMASVGIEAQAGGTAVQKVLLQMAEASVKGGKDLKIFADAIGLTVDEFRTGFAENATGIFQQFVETLGLEGQDAILTLEKLGLQDQRLQRAFLSLAGAGDLLGDALSTANIAFEEGTALSKEAGLRFGTTESQMFLFKNTIKDLGITIGDALLPFLNDLLEGVKPIIAELGEKLPEFLNTFVIPAITAVGNLLTGKTKPAFVELGLTLTPIIEGAKDLAAAFQEHFPAMQAAAREMVSWFSANMVPVIQSVVDTVGQLLTQLAGFWSEHGEAIIGIVSFIFKIIAATIGGAVQLLMGIIQGFLAILRGDWEGAWQAIVDALAGFMNLVLSIVGTNLDKFIETWTTNWELAKLIATTVWDGIVGAIGGAIDSIKGFIDGIIQKVGDFIDALKDVVIPKWLGNSPGTLEISLRGISEAMNELSLLQAPKLAAALPAGGGVGIASGGGPMLVVENLIVQAGSEADGRKIARQIMDELGQQVRMASSSGAGFAGT